MMTEAIRELAASYGIASEYVDARGTTIPIDSAVQRKLLQSMGVFDEDPPAPTGSTSRMLPACLVLRPEKGRINVAFRNAVEGHTIEWRLTLEDGTVRSGRAMLESTQVSDTAPSLTLADVPLGYHQLEVSGCDGPTSLIVTPGRCWLPDHFSAGEKSWGVSLQLYLLRSKSNWGIGDFSDLTRLSEQLGPLGCDALGLNPLHQMFLDAPEQASPYSPSDRQFLNVLNIDVERIPEFSRSEKARALVESPAFKNALQQCREAPNVDYAAACILKLEALRLVYASLPSDATAERIAGFHAFVAHGGEALQRAGLFQVLRSHFHKQDQAATGPAGWPEGLRSATSADVAEFASAHQAETDFLSWLQWIADQQLKAASEQAAAAGMRIGLYRDLAVGCDSSGGETWADPGAFLKGVQVGAPPDILNPTGQNWGLPPFNPASLVERAFVPFINLIRANMRYAGALRIDHVMGLQRLYCIPEGSSPSGGAFISFPVDDLVGIIALESHRQHCLVVGEDLGTVTEGFREKMAGANILSYRVTFFEQLKSGDYIAAEHYPALAVAVAGNHDMPTLSSWFTASDIDIRHALGLYPSDNETAAQRELRETQRTAMLNSLGLDETVGDHEISDAIHTFLGRTGSLLAMTQIDDLLGETHPVNVPGTSTEHANWRRKYSTDLEHFNQSEVVMTLIDRLKAGRKTGKEVHGEKQAGN